MKKLLFALCFAVPALVSAQITPATAPANSITVTGMAELEIVPDEIYVSVYLSEFTKDKKKYTIEELEKSFLNFVQTTTATPLADVKMDNTTARIIAMKRKQKDAVISKSYEIKYKDNEQVELLFAAADSLNAGNVYIVRYSHSKMDEYKQQVRENAMKDAKNKATYMLVAIGQKPGKATQVFDVSPQVGINDGVDDFRPFRGNMFRSIGDNMGSYSQNSRYEDGDGTASGIRKTIKLNYHVQVTFEIL
jgi:uncharacterized protein